MSCEEGLCPRQYENIFDKILVLKKVIHIFRLVNCVFFSIVQCVIVVGVMSEGLSKSVLSGRLGEERGVGAISLPSPGQLPLKLNKQTPTRNNTQQHAASTSRPYR